MQSRYFNDCMLNCFSCVRLFVTLWTVTYQALCSWASPGKNTGVGCHALLRGIFLIQRSNLCLLRLLCWQADSLPQCHYEAPYIFQSVQFSQLVVSNSLQAHESQHTRPPCPSPSPEFTQTHVHRVSDAIQPSHPLSSPFPPAPSPSQH